MNQKTNSHETGQEVDSARPAGDTVTLTQGDLLHQVQVAGEELAPERVVQVEGHAVATHGVVRLLPAVPERLVGSFVLKVWRGVVVLVFQGDLHACLVVQELCEGGGGAGQLLNLCS